MKIYRKIYVVFSNFAKRNNLQKKISQKKFKKSYKYKFLPSA